MLRFRVVHFDVCLTVHHRYKQYRKPTSCNHKNLLIFQSAQHVSGNFLAILRSSRLCFTAGGIMHPSCCRPVAWNAEALTVCSVWRMLLDCRAIINYWVRVFFYYFYVYVLMDCIGMIMTWYILLLCSHRAYWIINVNYVPTYAQISGVNLC